MAPLTGLRCREKHPMRLKACWVLIFFEEVRCKYMQNIEIQELNTTEQKVEVYANDIEIYLNQYCVEHEIKHKDLYTIDQSRWNSVLLYIYKHVFKPTPDNKPNNRYNGKSNIDYSNKELLDNVCDIYINLCYEYSKEVSIMGFSKLTGIHKDTLYTWLNDGDAGLGSSDLARKLSEEREESLSVRLVSGKGNPVGILGILNRHYGWNMGQPRGQEQKQQAPNIPQMEQKYLQNQEDKPQLPQFPALE